MRPSSLASPEPHDDTAKQEEREDYQPLPLSDRAARGEQHARDAKREEDTAHYDPPSHHSQDDKPYLAAGEGTCYFHAAADY